MLRIIVGIIVLFCFLCGPGPAPLHADTPEETYQAALMKEKGEGDLRAAIALYQQALDREDQVAPDFEEQIRGRLRLCRKRLELQTDDKP